MADVVTNEPQPGPKPVDPKPGKGRSRPTITRTTITPSPVGAADGTKPSRRSRRSKAAAGPDESSVAPVDATASDTDQGTGGTRERFLLGRRGDMTAARPPLPGTNIARAVMTSLLSALCLVSLGGAVLMLLLWQQQRNSGVLSSQISRAWELFDHLRDIERVVAVLVLPVAAIWMVLATVNVRRATGQRRNPLVTVASLAVGVGGAWAVGHEFVEPATDWVSRGLGIALQAVCVAVPMIALERIADSAEARRGPLRTAFVMAVASLAHLQAAGGISTIEATYDPTRWGRLAAYLVIGTLMMVLATLAANEAARGIEDGTHNRYELRQRFGESLLAQAGL